MIKKILTHLNFFEEKKYQRAPLRGEIEYTETPEFFPHDDGRPGYDESVFFIDQEHSTDTFVHDPLEDRRDESLFS